MMTQNDLFVLIMTTLSGEVFIWFDDQVMMLGDQDVNWCNNKVVMFCDQDAIWCDDQVEMLGD